MAEARVNTATVGVFSWSSLEPEPGRYEFAWLDDAMGQLHSAGVRVILATPTASPPPWFSRLHPEALPVTADGVRLLHGSRDTYNPAAPAYREAAARITRALAERYGTHPALAMWHLHNEYGTVSYGPVTDAAFRLWLADRYGDLAALPDRRQPRLPRGLRRVPAAEPPPRQDRGAAGARPRPRRWCGHRAGCAARDPRGPRVAWTAGRPGSHSRRVHRSTRQDTLPRGRGPTPSCMRGRVAPCSLPAPGGSRGGDVQRRASRRTSAASSGAEAQTGGRTHPVAQRGSDPDAPACYVLPDTSLRVRRQGRQGLGAAQVIEGPRRRPPARGLSRPPRLGQVSIQVDRRASPEVRGVAGPCGRARPPTPRRVPTQAADMRMMVARMLNTSISTMVEPKIAEAGLLENRPTRRPATCCRTVMSTAPMMVPISHARALRWPWGAPRRGRRSGSSSPAA